MRRRASESPRGLRHRASEARRELKVRGGAALSVCVSLDDHGGEETSALVEETSDVAKRATGGPPTDAIEVAEHDLEMLRSGSTTGWEAFETE
jgi:GTP cyclohydrolase III